MIEKNRYSTNHIILVAAAAVISVAPYISQNSKIIILFLMIFFLLAEIRLKKDYIPISRSFLIAQLCLILPAMLDINNAFKLSDYSLTNLMYPINFSCGYLIAKIMEKEEFFAIFRTFILFSAILSLFGSVFLLFPEKVLTFPQYYFNGDIHRTLYFSNYVFDGNWMAPRNSGFAWEPGLYQILLNLAFQMTIQKEKGMMLFIKSIIFIAAIALTKSTVGYMILIVNVVALMCKERKYIFLIFAVCIFSLPVIGSELTYQLTYKLNGNASAFQSRFIPTMNAIKFSVGKPLGIGSTAYNQIYFVERIGSYDAYSQVLVRYGYPMLLFVFARLVHLAKKNVGISLVLILGFLTEPIWGTALITIFYFIEEKQTSPEIRKAEWEKRFSYLR